MFALSIAKNYFFIVYVILSISFHIELCLWNTAICFIAAI